jgi:hypothetical protein
VVSQSMQCYLLITVWVSRVSPLCVGPMLCAARLAGWPLSSLESGIGGLCCQRGRLPRIKCVAASEHVAGFDGAGGFSDADSFRFAAVALVCAAFTVSR